LKNKTLLGKKEAFRLKAKGFFVAKILAKKRRPPNNNEKETAKPKQQEGQFCLREWYNNEP